jgi:hypothetical protein
MRATIPDGLGHVVELFLSSSEKHKPGISIRQSQRNRAPDPTRRSCYERNAP